MVILGIVLDAENARHLWETHYIRSITRRPLNRTCERDCRRLGDPSAAKPWRLKKDQLVQHCINCLPQLAFIHMVNLVGHCCQSSWLDETHSPKAEDLRRFHAAVNIRMSGTLIIFLLPDVK